MKSYLIKTILVTALICSVLLTLSGCDSTSQERLTALNQSLKVYQEKVGEADDTIHKLQNLIDEAHNVLATPGLEDIELIQKMKTQLSKAQEALPVVQAKKELLDTQVNKIQGEIDKILAGGQVDFNDELVIVGEGVKGVSTFLPPPWNGIVYALGVGLAGVFGIFRERKRRQVAEEVTKDLAESQSKVLKALPEKEKKLAQDEIEKVQDRKTKAIVNDIENGVQK